MTNIPLSTLKLTFERTAAELNSFDWFPNGAWQPVRLRDDHNQWTISCGG